jgi:hypothetical protein
MEFADTIRSAWSEQRSDPILKRWTRRLTGLFAPAVRRMRTSGKGRTLLVEERISLGPKKALLLISCRGQSFLVASGAEEISAILPLQASRRSSSTVGRQRVGIEGYRKP